VSLQDRREIFGQEVAIDGVERWREPTIIAAIDSPIVLMSIDANRLVHLVADFSRASAQSS